MYQQATVTIIQAQARPAQADRPGVRMRLGVGDGEVRDAVVVHTEEESLPFRRFGRTYQ
jgi:hypothetical protein